MSATLYFVVPWYGPQASGGAESAVRRTTEALYHRAGLDVEVLTTCSREFHSDWSVNELPEGRDEVNGVPVRRFRVRQRDARAFDAVNAKLMAGKTITADEERLFIREMINSDDLCEFVGERAETAFYVFTPYMFGTTYHGSRVAPDRSALIPALHDESYAYLGVYAGMFAAVRGVVCHSRAELALAHRLYRLRPGAAALVPDGVEPVGRGDGAAFRRKHGLGDYVLYVGRKEAGKNLPLLLEYFAWYRALRRDLRLVVLGKGPVTVPETLREHVLDLGFVSEQEKLDAYAGALALVQPSVNESFSLVMMEAWLAGTPCLVNERCAVTREHCVDSHGGLPFADAAEFAAAIDVLRERRAVRDALGRQGREYVERNFGWDRVIAGYLDALRRWGVEPRRRSSAPAFSRPRRAVRRIHQLVAGFGPGDAISNEALELQRLFRRWGLESEIFTSHLAPGTKVHCRPLTALRECVEPDDVLFYHHSIHSDAAEAYVVTLARRVLLYHNITPAEYFREVSPLHAELCRAGREWLPELVRASDCLLADSTFNAEEIQRFGADCHVVPFLADWNRLTGLTGDDAVVRAFGDGRTNLLFTGRLVPNKRQDALVEVLRCFRELDPTGRLILVGADETDGGRYAALVRRRVTEARLAGEVHFTGRVSDECLAAYYRVAHVFVCMSEHEGFCVPLVEAMAFGVPVVACPAGAVPETLGGAGVLVEDPDPRTVAAAVHRLVRDRTWRAEVVARQWRRLRDFAPGTVASTLQTCLEKCLAVSVASASGGALA